MDCGLEPKGEGLALKRSVVAQYSVATPFPMARIFSSWNRSATRASPLRIQAVHVKLNNEFLYVGDERKRRNQHNDASAGSRTRS